MGSSPMEKQAERSEQDNHSCNSSHIASIRHCIILHCCIIIFSVVLSYTFYRSQSKSASSSSRLRIDGFTFLRFPPKPSSSSSSSLSLPLTLFRSPSYVAAPGTCDLSITPTAVKSNSMSEEGRCQDQHYSYNSHAILQARPTFTFGIHAIKSNFRS